jgi:hypothetical protein
MNIFKHNKLSVRNITDDPKTTNQFVQRMLRYTKDIAILNADRSNWHTIIKNIWGSMDKDIRMALYAPLFNETLDDFILHIEEA